MYTLARIGVPYALWDRLLNLMPGVSKLTCPYRHLRRDASQADLLAAMMQIRGIEAALQQASIAGRLEGPVHVSLGEEAVAVGLAAALRPGDIVLSNHRGHGHALAVGLDPKTVIAEIVGHPSGFSMGRGGSMHIFDPARDFYGTNGIVGGNSGVAVGAALALQLQRPGSVAVVVFGDGAMAAGIVYEAFNLGVLWRLPVVFVCENNGYAELTPTSVHLSSKPTERARGFGLEVESIDGTEVRQVIDGLSRAIERAATGRSSFVEATCYRFGGHYAADPALYRPEGEDAQWRQSHCPIRKLGRRLSLSEAELEAGIGKIQAEAGRLIEELAA